jgi:hypothetical protein
MTTFTIKTDRNDPRAVFIDADNEEHAANAYGTNIGFPYPLYVNGVKYTTYKDADGNLTYKKDSREYVFRFNRQDYLVQIRPDIAVHGGLNGPGTQTSIWRLNDDGSVIPGVRGYQGRHSKAGLIRLIKAANWSSNPHNEPNQVA